MSGSENLAFEVLSEKTYFSRAKQWQLRQKLEVRRQYLGEIVSDNSFDILSYCSRLKWPKSEWLYCFVRGLRPEIRDHVILHQPPDLESALNIAKLKELVVNSCSSKSNSGQEVENFEKLVCKPSEEEKQQAVRDEFNVWTKTSQNDGNRRVNRKFQSGKT